MQNSSKKLSFILFLLVLVLGMGLVSLCLGQYYVDFKSVLGVLAEGLGMTDAGLSDAARAIVWYVRLPRVLVALMVGSALAMSGAVMQGLFGNPLADPGIVGVSAGASTGAVVAIALGFTAANALITPIFAFAGSLIAVGLTLFLSMRQGKIPVMTLLLAGVAVGMLLGAVTSGILTLMNEQQTQQYLFWMVGGLDYRRWEHVYLALGPITLGLLLMLLAARHLNVLVLGETEAKAVGVPVALYRTGLLLIASMTTAASVCVSGNIGFVGLVIPHMMRMLIGADHRVLLPASALGGAFFLLLCDTLGRIVMPPTEIRVGIVTALLGAPYFLYLLRRLQKEIF